MSIASKNMYELLGNDPEQDPEREPEPPTKAVDRPAARSGKRDAPKEAPTRGSASAPRGGQRDGTHNANENSFRDRGVGSDKNRSRGSGDPGDYAPREGGRGGRGRGRGRGRGNGGAPQDRHSRGLPDHPKQGDAAWGGKDGDSEWADEKAGEAIAKQDEKEEGFVPEPTGGDAEPAAEAEPEDKTMSYAAYLAEQAEKKLSLAAGNVRKPNEGSSKKFPEGKAIERDDQEDFISGAGAKAKRERERKQKEHVALDDANMYDKGQQQSGGFRGRGRGRGEGRGRGGRGRGEGGRGRGEGRGRGGGGQSGVNLSDASAFPSLGS